MDRLFAIELNGSWKAEKMSICHFKASWRARSASEGYMFSVLSANYAHTVHTRTHDFHQIRL